MVGVTYLDSIFYGDMRHCHFDIYSLLHTISAYHLESHLPGYYKCFKLNAGAGHVSYYCSEATISDLLQ